ncbi:MAG: DNA repair protein RecO [Oscillospiraceae bacterium]|nr:DNA repair protein RecO [Oscillospiraceae bacterium]
MANREQAERQRLQSEGLVLRERTAGENDRLVTLLTKEYGVLRAFARGARKAGSNQQSATQLFCFGKYELTRWQETYRVAEVSPTELFFGLRGQVERVALAEYFCELAEELAPQEEPAPEQLRLLLNAFHFLAGGRRPQPLLKAAVELRLMALAGYRPDLEEDGPVGGVQYLDCAAGTLTQRQGTYTAALAPGILEALRFLCTAELSKLFHFTMSDQGLRALSAVTGTYIRCQLGKQFATLRFYEGLGGSKVF